MRDRPRTAEQLRAQIAALQVKLEELEHRGSGGLALRGAPQAPGKGSPSGVPGPITRRSVFALWRAPMILLAPAVKSATRFARAVKRHSAA